MSAILGPEMGAPILWAPGIFAFFLQENLQVHKIPRFSGGEGYFGFSAGGGECRFYVSGRRDFSDLSQKHPDVHKIVLSIKVRSPPPPGRSVNFEDSVLICTVFPHFGPFRGGGGGKTKFCGQEFYGHQTFLIKKEGKKIRGEPLRILPKGCNLQSAVSRRASTRCLVIISWDLHHISMIYEHCVLTMVVAWGKLL